jgi:hypothetical protein
MASRKGTQSSAKGRGKKKSRKGCLIGGCFLFIVLLLATAFALDQYNIFPLRLGETRIPRVLPGAKGDEEAESAVEETESAAESAPADAEALAAGRLDRQEGPGGESAAPESGPASRRDVVIEPTPSTESAASPLRVTLPPGGLRSLDPNSAHAKELKQRIQSVGGIIQAMKAKSASETLQRMPLELQVEILRTMDEKAVAKVLDEMDADTRGKLAVALVQQ